MMYLLVATINLEALLFKEFVENNSIKFKALTANSNEKFSP